MSLHGVHAQTISSVPLVFGLEWFAIIGSDAGREARRIARQNKATHLVLDGPNAACVGLARLGADHRRLPVYSAAMLVARRYAEGTVAMVIEIAERLWWLLAVHDGAVIARTDRLFTSQNEALTIIAELRQTYPALDVLGDARPLPELAELVRDSRANTLLRRIPSYRRLSAPIVLGVAVLLSIAMPSIKDAWTQWRTQSTTPIMADSSVSQAWQAAIDVAAKDYWIHGTSGTSAMLDMLYSLPVVVAGWRLSRAECTSAKAQWHCGAHYQRNDHNASNALFLDQALPQWKTSFTPLDEAHVRWTAVSHGLEIGHVRLNSAAYNERHLFSHWQSIKAAVPMMAIAEPRPMAVLPPLDGDGVPMVRPDSLSLYSLRRIEIRAPLRSASLLLPHCKDIGWHRVVLDVARHATPSLGQSRLLATFHGDLYEQN